MLSECNSQRFEKTEETKIPVIQQHTIKHTSLPWEWFWALALQVWSTATSLPPFLPSLFVQRPLVGTIFHLSENQIPGASRAVGPATHASLTAHPCALRSSSSLSTVTRTAAHLRAVVFIINWPPSCPSTDRTDQCCAFAESNSPHKSISSLFEAAGVYVSLTQRQNVYTACMWHLVKCQHTDTYAVVAFGSFFFSPTHRDLFTTVSLTHFSWNQSTAANMTGKLKSARTRTHSEAWRIQCDRGKANEGKHALRNYKANRGRGSKEERKITQFSLTHIVPITRCGFPHLRWPPCCQHFCTVTVATRRVRDNEKRKVVQA